MIAVKPTEKDFNECISCGKSEREDNEKVFFVSMGTETSQMSSIRICKPCSLEISKGIEELENH